MKKLDSELRKEIGKYFLDISKLIFGGVVLTSIVQLNNINRGLVMAIGVVISLMLALFGFLILKMK